MRLHGLVARRKNCVCRPDLQESVFVREGTKRMVVLRAPAPDRSRPWIAVIESWQQRLLQLPSTGPHMLFHGIAL